MTLYTLKDSVEGKLLHDLLRRHRFNFKEVRDCDLIAKENLKELPALVLGDHAMNFDEALKFIKETINK